MRDELLAREGSSVTSTRSAACVDSRVMAKPERRVTLVRLVAPGVHLDGSLTQLVNSAGVGTHRGWSFTEDAAGVVASKGSVSARIPWARIALVEYADG